MKDFFEEIKNMIRPEHVGLFFLVAAVLGAMVYEHQKYLRIKTAVRWLIGCNILLVLGVSLLAYVVYSKGV